MFRYLVKRFLISIPVLLLALFATFALLTYIPGSRLGYFPIEGNGDLLDKLFVALNAPANLLTRYLRYFYNVFVHARFGSIAYHHNLSAEIFRRTGFTLLLTFCAFLLILLIGIPLGSYSAYKKGSFFDNIVSIVSLFLSSIPPFCLAIFLAVIFCVRLRLLPVFGFDGPKNMILPTITIGAAGLAKTIQTVRNNVIENLNKPYVKTLKAKGVRQSRILFVHALKNSLVPTVSIIKEMTAEVFVSTFIAEWFYAIPGIGYYLLQSVNGRDYDAVLAATTVITIFILLFGILSDTLSYSLDPQLKHSMFKGEGNEQ